MSLSASSDLGCHACLLWRFQFALLWTLGTRNYSPCALSVSTPWRLIDFARNYEAGWVMTKNSWQSSTKRMRSCKRLKAPLCEYGTTHINTVHKLHLFMAVDSLAQGAVTPMSQGILHSLAFTLLNSLWRRALKSLGRRP